MNSAKKRGLLLAMIAMIGMMLFSACGTKVSTSISGADPRVVKGYNAAVSFYQKNTAFESYWAVFAAYAALGDTIQDGSYTYDASGDDQAQQGAIVLARIMMGENPYDDNGQDLVAPLLEKGVEGSFAIPVFDFLALQAAGADIDADTEAAFIDYCCEQLTTLSLGPDIGGWSAVALERYLDDPDYSAEITAAIDGYTSIVGKNLTSGTMGSTGISAGCVVAGLTALTDAGLTGYDATKDSPWRDEDPLAVMYVNLINGEENVSSYYNSQYYLEFSDLYQVLYEDNDMAWIRCGVNADKLDDLITKGEKLTAENPTDTTLSNALTAAKSLTDEELAAVVPTWGSVYYALCDAVEQYE